MAAKLKLKKRPLRSQVKPADTWDLSSLFAADEAWEEAFLDWEGKIPAYESFQGKLGRNAETLAAALAFDLEVERSGERLGSYASLRSAEDTANSVYQRMQGRWLNVASRAAEAASYLRPEILAVPAAKMKRFLADPRLRALPDPLGAAARREAAHAFGERGAVAGDANGDGPDGQPGVRAAQRRRSEIRRNPGRQRQADRADARHVSDALALTQAERPKNGVSPALPPVRGA